MAPVPTKPLFLVSGFTAQGTQTETHPCGCWEETKQGYTVAYQRCGDHALEEKPSAKVLEPKSKPRKRRKRG